MKALGKIVVGTGWWCEGDRTAGVVGSNAQRSQYFFDLWYHCVQRYIAPEKIIVVDSASPVRPRLDDKPNVEFVSLDRNYLHSRALAQRVLVTKYAGWTRSVFLSACYAAMCDADYYVYVEQDCLIHGEGFLQEGVSRGASGIWLGYWHRNARGASGGHFNSNVVQTSVMIARSESILRFANGSVLGPQSDGEYAPEKRLMGNCKPYDVLHLPYGRNRPIDWTKPHLYAQHLTDDEIAGFLRLNGLNPGDVFPEGYLRQGEATVPGG